MTGTQYIVVLYNMQNMKNRRKNILSRRRKATANATEETNDDPGEEPQHAPPRLDNVTDETKNDAPPYIPI